MNYNLQVNLSSLFGRSALNQTQSALQTSINNLSSGLRIHTAKDDPVGFVSTTAMQTDIVSVKQAIANSARADAVLATADSALGHVSTLLTDLRGIITQAANTGVENTATLASLQLQADSILEAINHISQSTTFQNQKLLDGSLDFNVFPATGTKAVSMTNVNVFAANFLGKTEKDVSVQIISPPQQAALYYPYGALKTDTTFSLGGTLGYNTFSFDGDATVYDIANAVNRVSDSTGVGAQIYASSTPGNVVLTSYGQNNDIIINASKTGEVNGNYVFRFVKPAQINEGDSASSVAADKAFINFYEGNGNNPAIIEVVLRTDADGNVLSTANEIADLINTDPQLYDPLEKIQRLSAAIPADQTGAGVVSPFKDFAYYGGTDTSNFLQFLAPEGAPNIRFACGQPGEPLNVTDADGDFLTIHLEVDRYGRVKTTANDLVKFFDHPPNNDAKTILDQYGISVSVIDPAHPNLPCAGDSPNGYGVLTPTYDPKSCPPDGSPPDITFTSYGDGLVQQHAAAVLGNFTITATQKGAAYNGVQVFILSNEEPVNSVSYDPVSKQLVIRIDPNTEMTAQQVADLVNSDDEVSRWFTASTDGTGTVSIGDWTTLTGGVQLAADNTAEIEHLGVRMFSGADCEQLGITFFSTEFGSSEFVDLQNLYPDSDFFVTDRFGNVVERTYGQDVAANINGQPAIGIGRTAKTVTSNLDIEVEIAPNVSSGAVFGFRITGGGALVQLSQNTDWSLQTRIGLPSIHTSKLGSDAGTLAELKSGEAHNLMDDANGAFRIVDDVTEQIAALRGRIGTFQSYRLASNIDVLTDGLELETEAQSGIQDTDFAQEAANMSRLQLLMQSSISVLGQVNTMQQLLLSLLSR